MDKYSYTFIILIYTMHFVLLTYWQEFLLGRQPWFRGKVLPGRIEGFGKCQSFFGSRAALEHYAIVSYFVGGRERIGKISRSVDDKLGNRVMLAVSGNVAARYEKCNWHIGRDSNNEMGASLCKRYTSLYISLQVAAVAGTLAGCALHDFRFAKMYLAYLLVAILSYAFLRQMIGIRNFMWRQRAGGMKIDENEWRKAHIALIAILSLAYSFFLGVEIVAHDSIAHLFGWSGIIILLIFFAAQLAKGLENKEEPTAPDSKVLLAKVVSIDNSHEAKKLICQVEHGHETMQYQKIQYINFLEQVGDFVEVRVELGDEGKYEVLNRMEG